MKKLTKMSDIRVEEVYPGEISAYKALRHIVSGVYRPPIGADYRLDILTSETSNKKNIQLQLTSMGKTITLPINFVATDGRWLYENILEHEYLGDVSILL